MPRNYSENGIYGVTEIEQRLLDIARDGQLTWEDCRDIFRYFPMGKRIARALPRFSFSAEREIIVPEAPEEAIQAFKKMAIKLSQDKIIYRASVYARIYGLSGIFVSCNGKNNMDNITYRDVQKGIRFNALDSLNLAGSYFSQDVLSEKFMKPDPVTINGQKVGSKRVCTILNGDPLYLNFNESTYNFAGISVYANMTNLIQSWTRAMISIRRMLTKASSVVFKSRDGDKLNPNQVTAAKKSLQLLQAMENTGGVSIERADDVSFFPMTGVGEIDTLLKSVENEILYALDDTPQALLLNANISNGLSEGSEEFKAIMIAIDSFRKEILSPLYAFTDPFVMASAWTNEFILRITENDKRYFGMSPAKIRQYWMENFEYSYRSLFPKTSLEEETEKAVSLDNLLKVRQLGGNYADIEEEINEKKLFNNDISIDPTPMLDSNGQYNLFPDEEDSEE